GDKVVWSADGKTIAVYTLSAPEPMKPARAVVRFLSPHDGTLLDGPLPVSLASRRAASTEGTQTGRSSIGGETIGVADGGRMLAVTVGGEEVLIRRDGTEAWRCELPLLSSYTYSYGGMNYDYSSCGVGRLAPDGKRVWMAGKQQLDAYDVVGGRVRLLPTVE